jgi:hypothetical protein
MNVQALAEVFRQAEAAAVEAGKVLTEDGGTCNFDSPAFRIERARKADIAAAAETAGIRVSEFHWFGGQKWFWLCTTVHGQGNLRTRMAEAACKVLKAAEGQIKGLQVSMYYQMD